MPNPQAIAPVAPPVRMQALHSQPFRVLIPASLLMLGLWPGSSLLPFCPQLSRYKVPISPAQV